MEKNPIHEAEKKRLMEYHEWVKEDPENRMPPCRVLTVEEMYEECEECPGIFKKNCKHPSPCEWIYPFAPICEFAKIYMKYFAPSFEVKIP